MTNHEILTRFTQILRDLLDNHSIVLALDTTRADVPNWDSFNYVNFIVSIEIEFGVQFAVGNVESFNTVGDIVTELRSLVG